MKYDVPFELKNAIESISGDGWRVLAFLSEGDKTERELEALGIEGLDYHLKSLVRGGLVRKYVESLADLTDSDKTFYGLTPIGKSFIGWITDLLGVFTKDIEDIEKQGGTAKVVKKQTVECVWCDMFKEFMPIKYCMKQCGRFGGFSGLGIIRCMYEG